MQELFIDNRENGMSFSYNLFINNTSLRETSADHFVIFMICYVECERVVKTSVIYIHIAVR